MLGGSCFDSLVLLFDFVEMDFPMPSRCLAHVDLASPVFSFLRQGSFTFILDFLHMGSSMLPKSYKCPDLAFSIYSSGRIAFSPFAPDFLHLDSSLSVHAPSHLSFAFSISGRSCIGSLASTWISHTLVSCHRFMRLHISTCQCHCLAVAVLVQAC